MDFKELSLKRESCRAYTGAPVPDEALMDIAEACRLATSACNNQAWRLYFVQQPESVSAIADAVRAYGINKFADKVGAFIVLATVKETYPDRLTTGAPMRDFTEIDVGIAAAAMTYAAADIGYGSCIMGRFDDAAVRAVCGVKDDESVMLVIALGVSASDRPRVKTRKSMDEIAKFGI